VRQVNGHDIDELKAAFDAMPFEPGKPSLIIAHTIKGKGVSYMENSVKWHHGVPNKEQYADAINELNGALTLMY
jgi:transketolase